MNTLIGTAVRDLIIAVLAYRLGGWLYVAYAVLGLFVYNILSAITTHYITERLNEYPTIK